MTNCLLLYLSGVLLWKQCVLKIQKFIVTYYHYFVARPWVEYKGMIPQNEMLNKKNDLELEANGLISVGGKVSCCIINCFSCVYVYITHLVLKSLTLLLRYLSIHYPMMKLLDFVVVAFLIMFPRSVHQTKKKKTSISQIVVLFLEWTNCRLCYN